MHTIQEVTKTEHAGGVNSWYGLYDVAHQDITYGTNNTAVLKGHMIFGSEYAQVLSFIDSNNASYSSTGHQNKQETIAHKSGNVTQTSEEQGSKTLDIVNNIVDLEGNLYELTAQANDTYYRVRRGCDYGNASGSGFSPASNSGSIIPTVTNSNYGVRQSLYVAL